MVVLVSGAALEAEASPPEPAGTEARAPGAPSGPALRSGNGASQGGNPVPPLAVVLKHAGERAPQVRLGQAALEVGRTAKINAGRAPIDNPYFELVGQKVMDGASNPSWGITAWLPLELFGQRSRRIDEAKAYESIYDANLSLAEASAFGEVYSTYGSVQVAAERVRVLEQMVTVSKKTAEIYQARVDAGDAILRDATIAKVDLAKNEVLLQDARGRLAAALTNLNRITGSNYDGIDEPDIVPPAFDLEKYLDRVEEDLPPAVASSEAEAKYYQAQRKRLGKESLGPVTLMLLGGQGSVGDAQLGLGLAYTMPVFRSAQGDKARAEREVLRAQTQASVWRSYIDHRIDGIVQQYQQGEKAYALLTDIALPAAKNAVESSMATLEAGKEDWFAVLISRRDQAVLALQRLDLVERQWSLLGELVQLTGELP